MAILEPAKRIPQETLKSQSKIALKSAMAEPLKHFYEFSNYRIDPEARVLLHDGKVAPMTPKLFGTLLALVERNGKVVTKDELIKFVWPDTFVEESNLTQNISMLRKLLGESPDEPQYIETVPRRGYRFVADVKEVAEEGLDAVIRLTHTGKAARAAISPDGKYVAHVIEESGKQSLWLRQVATSSEIQIVPPDEVAYIGITFSPDGNFIYYVRGQQRDLREGSFGDRGTLFKTPTLGKTEQKMLTELDGQITLSHQ